MKKITDFLRKIGVLHVSSGDYQTGDLDTREDLKEKPEEAAQSGDQQKENQEDHDHKHGGSCCNH